MKGCELERTNHSIISYSCRTRRSYSSEDKPSVNGPDKKAPKKRMTMNSQEASLSLEDVLAVRNALGFNQNNRHSSKSPSPSPTTATFDEDLQQDRSIPHTKRKREAIAINSSSMTIKEDEPEQPSSSQSVSTSTAALSSLSELSGNGPETNKNQTTDLEGICLYLCNGIMWKTTDRSSSFSSC